MLITDGAPCYPSLSHKFGARHEACNHSKVGSMRCGDYQSRPYHVVSTRTKGHVNPKLVRRIRLWQWRWMNSKTKSLLEVTGRSLKNRMAMWEGKNIAHLFKRKFPVNYWSSSKNPSISQGILSENASVVSHSFAMAKTTFYSKRSQPLARLSPRPDVFDPAQCMGAWHTFLMPIALMLLKSVKFLGMWGSD